MALATIRDRPCGVEKRRKLLDWFVRHRFYDNLTSEELET
jgi:hypothetical protein